MCICKVDEARNVRGGENGEVTDISLVSYQASHPWSSTNVATQSGVGRYRAGLCREAWRWDCTILVHAD
ncbi:hypothetical protein HZ326_23393 [Fusarium oxysporum f. sp. albedinis]|nr:hypothetical protein HZ326_23983 [Fusarium oxysporum f. sp. albedinis]KAJ0133543.1 hypothetical protein HZ326_23393 [Fusarium oxysporum f. sp. albedinis]